MKPSLQLLLVFCIVGCASFPSTFEGESTDFENELRTIILEDKTLKEKVAGDFISWECRDYIKDEESVLVEVGTFSAPDLNGYGFVIYDGGNSGNATGHKRVGLSLRWDWGPNGNDFAFVLKPDGSGYFYDFSSPGSKSVKADQLFKCRKRR